MNTLHLRTDGASRGNPGPAGIGVVVEDDNGERVVETGKYIGKATNNEAEYHALIAGLIAAQDLKPERLEVHLDSELVVKQINGEYKVREAGLKPLHEEAIKLRAGFSGEVVIRHVSREQNGAADELANRAIDEHREPRGAPPSTEAGDIARGLARAALASVPVVGGAAAELLDLAVAPALHRRYDKWMQHLSEAVDDMRAHSLDIRHLADNEAVVTVILTATQAAARTHDEEKLEALRNAITNAALGLEPDEHVQMMFVRFVDELQPLHLRMLALFRDPGAFLEGHQIPRPTRSGSRTLLVEAIAPGVPQEIYTLAANDLTTRGLMNGSISGMISDAGMWQSITTPLGNRFLDFISKPKGRG